MASATPALAAPDLLAETFRLVRRALRARYRLAAATAVLGALCGGAAAWKFTPKTFRSQGLIRILSMPASDTADGDAAASARPVTDSYMQSQAVLLSSRQVAERALLESPWLATLRGNSPEILRTFVLTLKVEAKPRTDFIRVWFTDRDPRVAASGVRAALTAYQAVLQRQHQGIDRERLATLQKQRVALAGELERVQQQGAFGMRTPPASALIAAETAWQLAPNDPLLRRFVDELSQQETTLQQLTLRLGEAHPQVVACNRSILRLRERVVQRLQALAANGIIEPGQLPFAQTPSSPGQVQVLRLAKELADIDRHIQQIQLHGTAPRLDVVSQGEVPLWPEGRSQMRNGVAGACVGAACPLAVLVALGLRQLRYRRCEELAEDFGSDAAWYASIPMLATRPDSGWDTAAECVNHLRARMQTGESPAATGGATEGCGGRVFLVSSVNVGEGRTSVAVALGLSLAGAGCRTVLVDFDLAHGRLTQKLVGGDCGGLRQAIERGEAGRFVRTMRSGLSVLPVGADLSNGFRLNEAKVAQLLAELRREFAFVLVDGGPILSSVETALLARQSDGVLLLVGYEQEPRLVAAAMEQLRAQRVRSIGVVFNRGDLRDVHYATTPKPFIEIASSAPSSAEAVPLEPDRPAPRALTLIGPLPCAVARSLALSREDDFELLSPVESKRLWLSSSDVAQAAPVVTADARPTMNAA